MTRLIREIKKRDLLFLTKVTQVSIQEINLQEGSMTREVLLSNRDQPLLMITSITWDLTETLEEDFLTCDKKPQEDLNPLEEGTVEIVMMMRDLLSISSLTSLLLSIWEIKDMIKSTLSIKHLLELKESFSEMIMDSKTLEEIIWITIMAFRGRWQNHPSLRETLILTTFKKANSRTSSRISEVERRTTKDFSTNLVRKKILVIKT